jgi:hypothetical protein
VRGRSRQSTLRLGSICFAAMMAFLGIAAMLRIGWREGFAYALIPFVLAVLLMVIALKPRGRPPKVRVRRYGANN